MLAVYCNRCDQCTYQVVSKKLHDKSGILVAFLTQSIELGNGIIEGLLGEVAGLVRRVQDLVVEDGEVQGKTETDGMCRSQVRGGNLGSLLVSLQ